MQLKFALATLALVAPALADSMQLVYPRQGGNQGGLALDPSLVQIASSRTGQEGEPVAGQVDSETSNNNFINVCGEKADRPLTNGLQIFQGSCNGITMGEIMAKDKMPAQFIKFPKNGDQIPTGQDITFQINVINMETGHFTNAQRTYYAAPQRINNNGLLVGHSHVSVQKINSLDDTTPKDLQTFAFFQGLNAPDVNGVLSATAKGGLDPGFYRCCSMGSSSNHALAVLPVAQRAFENDCIRFEVTGAAGGNGANAGAGAGGNAGAGAGGNAGAGAGGNAGAGAGGNAGNAGGNAGNAGGNAGNAGGNAGNAGGNQNGQVRGQGRGGNRGGNRGQKRSNLTPSSGRRSFTPSGRSRIARV